MDLVLTSILGRNNFIDLFVEPNILMRNRPEVFTFKKRKQLFVLESGAGGILGHAHAIVETFPESRIRGAKMYFTLESEYAHSHPDTTHVYYVAKNSSGVYAIFDYDTKTECTKSYFGAGHTHGLAVREVVDLFIV